MNPAFEQGRNWRKYSACYNEQQDTELFFTGNEEGSKMAPLSADEMRAIAVCNRCPVSGNCLMFAMDNKLKGIWGGMPTRQRERLARPSWRRKCVRCDSQDSIMEDQIQICRTCGLSWFVRKQPKPTKVTV
jgi:hypothetical protein